ncbi:U-box domain-containing protein 21 [Hordeum vulgare]|nr:U-box domain-containing protein 21 [Hordeum vulgare]
MTRLASPTSCKTLVSALFHGDVAARASDAIVLRELASSIDWHTIDIISRTPDMCSALVVLVKNPVSPQVTKAALVTAYYLVFGCNCMAALLLVSVVPDLLVDTDKEPSKKALDVLVKKMFRVSDMARELSSRPTDTGAGTSCAEELCVGALLKLLLLLQVGCGGMTKDRAS